ncbi:polyphosphate polymerase domain-containing protein [Sulfurovum sp. bin170]|uniref:polyphosphate polymerase domain-containing protein n=1 Tax=Sulfurovum sp. bin170 TaxID=2695268 RepID=UPI0013E05C79|nr:polyphosphate polymerase domain-containing protein [Sulfurovum sp. bin170]NEW61020.1 polyphosphate polymerase domain-containing protein [Sulfurovum sp. bin170]
MSNLKTFRHEFKYYINYFEYESLRRRLGAVLKRDAYSNESGDYHIRSLYFDDVKNSALYEKQAGVLTREKFRIRAYNISDKVIKLEKKSRIGQFIHKESASLTREQFDMIIDNDIEFLRRSDNTLFNEFYFNMVAKRLKPDVIVDYVREAYISNLNNIRITFDKHLKSGLMRTDMFNKDVPTIDVIEKPQFILEIKYDHFLPDYIRAILQLSSNQRYAISKFVICKKFTKFNNWEDN